MGRIHIDLYTLWRLVRAAGGRSKVRAHATPARQGKGSAKKERLYQVVWMTQTDE